MVYDPMDYLSSVSLSLDSIRIGASIGSAVQLALTDPLNGLGAAINMSVTARNLINTSPALFGTHAVTMVDPASTLSSLSTFRNPYQSLADVAIAEPFRGTISSLASVAGVADGIRAAYTATPPVASLFPAPLLSNSAALHSGFPDSLVTVRSLASPYMASAASVFALESSYAQLTRPIGALTIDVPPALLPGLTLGSITAFGSSIASLSAAAQVAWDSLGRGSASLSSYSPALLRSPALELYLSASASAAVTLAAPSLPEADGELEDLLQDSLDDFESRLAALDQDLVIAYKGAVAAIQSGAPDWQRHSMSSFRELTTHVLHRLAPDAVILPIAKSTDLHDGKPTRRARLNYVFAQAAGEEIARFFDADMKAALELFELLNAGTHRLGSRATPDQLHYLRGRVVGLIASMLAARGI